MKKTTEIENGIIEKLLPVCQRLRNEGVGDKEIQNIIRLHHYNKVRDFYKENNLNRLGNILLTMTKEFDEAGSKIELLLYDIFTKHNINFRFQYSIPPYRVDYLLWGYLIVELDGPQHELQQKRDQQRDGYLEKMGYLTLRIPTWVLVEEPKKVIEMVLKYKPQEKVKPKRRKGRTN